MRVEARTLLLYLHQTNPDLPPQVGVFVVTDAAGESVAHDIAMHVTAYMPALSLIAIRFPPTCRQGRTLRSRSRKVKPPPTSFKIVEGRLNDTGQLPC